MTKSDKQNRTVLPVSMAHKIDHLCDKFESDFSNDDSVRIESYVSELPANYRPFALQELLPLELELRGLSLNALSGAEYSKRFAEDAACLAELQRPPEKPEAKRQQTISMERPGSRLGPYLLREVIGKGGMGVVYLAEQQEPVKRQVALKIIKPGMDTGEVLARFEAERQALAMMGHPNIARVLDAGATDAGRPFFVMELVHGIPITDYCDAKQLDAEQRLKLFINVCQAIQHAHQKGIIHRDIKPSNVLVSETDNNHVVKVIDFGLAKAIERPLTDKSIHTQLTQILGTPLYMSPEQADVTSVDIDTRTDIYSLGVLLYELLTGHTPIDEQRFRQAAYDEMRRIIREEEPSKPSTKISSLGASASDVSSQRKTDPRRLSQSLRGDLDWIVMKSLEKNRDRRYETANGFARDVQRFLNDEPVLASPPSSRYRMQKFVRRNRVPVIAGSLIASALVLGMIGTTWGMFWALDEKERADNATKAETHAKQEVQMRADELQQVAEFQGEQLSEIDAAKMGLDIRAQLIEEFRKKLARNRVNDDEIEQQTAAFQQSLAGADFTALALDSLKMNIFDRALSTIDKKFGGQPKIQAMLSQTVGKTLRELGLLDAALDPLERSHTLFQNELGENDPETLRSLGQLGELLQRQGKYSEAEPIARKCLDSFREIQGDEHPNTVGSLMHLGAFLKDQGKLAEAEPLIRESLELNRRLLGNDHPTTLSSLNNLGGVLQDQGKLSEAVPVYAEGLEISRRIHGDEHPATFGLSNNYGVLLRSQGKYVEAEKLVREYSEVSRRILGGQHPRTLTLLSSLGALLIDQNKFSEAEPQIRECLAIKRIVLGDEHLSTLNTLNNLGVLLYKQGKLSEAESVYRECLKIKLQIQGSKHPDTLTSMNNLGSLLVAQGKLSEAVPIFRECLDVKSQILGNDHPSTLSSTNNLAVLLTRQGELDEAIPLLRKCLKARRRALGENHPSTLSSIGILGEALQAQGKFDEAAPLHLECLRLRRRVLGNEHPSTLASLENVGELRQIQGELEEAEVVRTELYNIRKKLFGEEHNVTLSARAQLGGLLLEREKYQDAERIVRECYLIRRKVLGDGNWLTANTQSMLGGAIAGQKRFAEAEPFLIEAYENMNPPEPATNRKTEALQRIIDLYEAWNAADPDKGHDVKANEWKTKLNEGNPLASIVSGARKPR